jgi:NTP pyrophosphatase (non-canonical NTP hydrolase)
MINENKRIMVSKEKINEFISRAYKTACGHGFHDEERSDEHWMMLVISEIGEMVEADRKNRRADVGAFKALEEIRIGSDAEYAEYVNKCFVEHIKDTLEDELADVVIRICDFLGTRHIEPLVLEEASTSDDWANIWGKDSINEQCYGLARIIIRIDKYTSADDIFCLLGASLAWCFDFADFHKIDLEWHIEHKMAYNESRPNKHGKGY